MKIKFNLIMVFILLIWLAVAVSANEIEEIEEGRQLVLSRVSCNILTNQQLENVGEYYMELMHPNELHEIIDQRMGGEGSESLRLVHINIAKMMYCGERNAMPINMMNLMMNRGGFQGMMSNFGTGYNMMGYYPYYGGWMMIFWILFLVLVVYLLYKLFNKEGFSFNSNASEILKRRYAKGEINEKEYQKMKKELK